MTIGCDKTFADVSSLARHRRTHTGVKPYACETCGKTFTRGTTLNKHMQMHSEAPSTSAPKTTKQANRTAATDDANEPPSAGQAASMYTAPYPSLGSNRDFDLLGDDDTLLTEEDIERMEAERRLAEGERTQEEINHFAETISEAVANGDIQIPLPLDGSSIDPDLR